MTMKNAVNIRVEAGRTFGPRTLRECSTRLEAWSAANGRVCAACMRQPAWKSGLCGSCWTNDTHPAVRELLQARGLPAPGYDDGDRPVARR